ncbi:hypothetical protein [Lachnoclostridium phytofermentans]|uniref:Uncharacterized protein n=1 Tax=Lachnoclostridium phytofermentans (strain ATCC 700394 / DSM 18823 / ISDg) TaxID=357809 RepID=A9KMS7_LACP7|nr:hypothetical protein [Lachnoclostridium phytofermentans]ABX42938.1 hypothetical protein Cphy_2577 [Lachnoclostridium phytofermentans ISDg]
MGKRLRKGSLKWSEIIVIVVLIVGLFLVIFWKPLRLDRYYLFPNAIDWVDCVKVNDITYYNNLFPREEVALTEIGDEIGKVKFTVSKNVHNPNYKLRNLDATFLEKGTNLYRILNTDDSIAVLIEGKYYRYQK